MAALLSHRSRTYMLIPFLKSNEENVCKKPEANIFLLILYVVCFSVLFLFMCFGDTKYSGFIRIHVVLS